MSDDVIGYVRTTLGLPGDLLVSEGYPLHDGGRVTLVNGDSFSITATRAITIVVYIGSGPPVDAPGTKLL